MNESQLTKQDNEELSSINQQHPVKSLSRAQETHLKDLINQVFVRLGSIYGNWFKSQFKSLDELEAAKKEWGIELCRYTRKEISMALSVCKHHYMGPPSLPKFLALLRSQPKPDRFKSLPKPPRNRELALKALAEQQSILGR